MVIKASVKGAFLMHKTGHRPNKRGGKKMSENNTTVTTPEGTANQQERTFTQSELDAIVKDRLAREKGKYADYDALKEKANRLDEIEESNKTELQKATERADELQAQLDKMNKANAVRDAREKVSQMHGVPVELLTGEDETTCTQQAQSILAFAKKSSYPSVPDGGESNAPTVTKKEILEIKNDKQRLKAIEENISLFN